MKRNDRDGEAFKSLDKQKCSVRTKDAEFVSRKVIVANVGTVHKKFGVKN